jgi:hypothetical protein
MSLPFEGDHWLPGFNFNVEEWFEGDCYETLAICRSRGFGPRGGAFLTVRRYRHAKLCEILDPFAGKKKPRTC